ncbi:hypothetical protein [Nocardia nova]|uniref:hypothetical protein n=1 Tax=Nocardia nova TaxID=37330 RepID=UPI0011AFD519
MQALKQAANGIGGDMVMPDSWMSPQREILIRARHSMGLGRQQFADRLNEVLGEPKPFEARVDWRAIDVWESVMKPPQHIVDAALLLLRGVRVVALDTAEVAA